MSSRIVIGKHAVRQTIASDQHIEKLYIRDRQKMNDDLRRLIDSAKKNASKFSGWNLIDLTNGFQEIIKGWPALPIHLIKPRLTILFPIK